MYSTDNLIYKSIKWHLQIEVLHTCSLLCFHCKLLNPTMFGPPKKKTSPLETIFSLQCCQDRNITREQEKEWKRIESVCQATRNRDTGGASAWVAINLDLSSVAKRETKLTSEHLSHVQFKRCSEGWIRADKASKMNRAQKQKRCLHVQRAQDFWLEDYNNLQILCWCRLEIEPSWESTCQLLLPPLPEPDCSTVLLISHLPGTCPPVKFLHLSTTCKRNSFYV